MKLNIMNIIATSTLPEKVSLTKLVKLSNVEYSDEEKKAVIIRFNEVAIIIFPSGNLIITGTTSIEQAKEISNQIEKIIEDLKWKKK